MSAEVRIVPARWSCEPERAAAVAVRRQVFIVEQEVPASLELDEADPSCRHWLALGSGERAIGTARMQANGHIGRIAVLAEWRGRGIGARLVEEIVAAARAAGLSSVDLDSQVHAIGFYEKLGFAVHGEVFMEAGIPHQNMARALD
jgi:predicted GNAT family N-acyltransferase